MELLDKIDRFVHKITLIAGGIAVLSLMILATGNVCLRVFHAPFRGAYELVSFMGAVTIAFALGYTQKAKANIIVDIVSHGYPERVKRVLDGFSSLVVMLFFGLIAWVLFEWGVRIKDSGEMSETLKIIYYPFIYCTAVGFSSLAFTLFVDVLKVLTRKEGSEGP